LCPHVPIVQATIVGSSVYNVLIIIGWSAIAGKDIMLDWKPLVRDSVFYFITIIYLICTFTDGYIHFYNGFIAVMLYACYVLFMTQNQKAFAKMDELAVRGRRVVVRLF
jgi:Ca2+/Na+ antiporter